MPRALVIGGTGFFGIDLVNHLLDSGWDVTVASKTMRKAPFHGQPERAQVDRVDPESLKRLAATATWDVLYDQRCFSSYDASILLDAMQSRVGKIVHTSSTAVYQPGSQIHESSFDPATHPYEIGPRRNYDDGKREAEAFYAANAAIPVAMGRLAVVLGFPDTSHRITQHVQAVLECRPVLMSNPDAVTSLISRQDAGRFIASLGMLDVAGPVNGASPRPISMRELFGCLGQELGKEVKFTTERKGAFVPGYGRDFDTSLDVSRAVGLGIPFDDVLKSLPVMVQAVKHMIQPEPAREKPRAQEMRP